MNTALETRLNTTYKAQVHISSEMRLPLGVNQGHMALLTTLAFQQEAKLIVTPKDHPQVPSLTKLFLFH